MHRLNRKNNNRIW